MLRTVIKTNSRHLSIQLPDDLVGKEVEVIAFAVAETEDAVKSDTVMTHLASEAVLAKDWLNTDEDSAWQNL